MRIFAGTSGYSYKEWVGPFYPDGTSASEMLRRYAERLPAVEINNTFYRLPSRNVIASWAEQVPFDFRFAIKASRRITHIRRLRNASNETQYLTETLAALGDRLGPLLFQLPPNLKKDIDRLEDFLDELPRGTPAAFEFRHTSWNDADVFAQLERYGAALVTSDSGDGTADIVRTASFGYLRLRRPGYSDAELIDWWDRIDGQGWNEAYVFFKHEEAGAGPALARRFLDLATT